MLKILASIVEEFKSEEAENETEETDKESEEKEEEKTALANEEE